MRKVWPPLVLLLLLAAFGGLAWLTRHPEAPVLARATGWPGVGRLAAAFRSRYVPEPRPALAATPGPGDRQGEPAHGDEPRRQERGAVAAGDPGAEAAGALPRIWIAPGDRLRAAPRDDATALAEVDRLANVGYVGEEGEWRRIVWNGVAGWVRARPEDEPPLGRAPAPVLPAAPRPPEAAALAAARRLLEPPERQGRLGPYALYTDVADPALLRLLADAASGIEAAYRDRYGLAPVGQPAEAVVLFRRCGAYTAFQLSEGGPGRAAGHVARGVVGLCSEGRLPEDVRATFLHELLHLLNRRAIGPALPPWLEEGIADDLAQARVEGGRPVPGTTAQVVVRTGLAWEVHGGLAAADLLRRSLGAGTLLPLRELLALDTGGFRGVEPPTLAYAQASFFVRFLLGGDHAAGFRGFLAAVARGGPTDAEALAAALGEPLEALDGEYRAWLARALPLPPA